MPEPQIQETGIDGLITEVALCLVAQRPNDWYASGTAVVIAPHLAVTAKHVVDDYWRHFEEERKLKFSDLHGEFGLIAQQVLPGQQGALWKVRRLWCSEHSDLAVLFLEPFSEVAKDYRWRCPRLLLHPPAIGDDVACFGYARTVADAKFDSNQTTVRIAGAPSTAVGNVVDVHPTRRDYGMMNFPCFRTNAPFTHGMSGGPIFVNGCLVDIVCGGGLKDAVGHVMAYGVSLWPLLAMKLQLDIANYPSNSWYAVVELVKQGYIQAVDLERFRVTEIEAGCYSVCPKLPESADGASSIAYS